MYYKKGYFQQFDIFVIIKAIEIFQKALISETLFSTGVLADIKLDLVERFYCQFNCLKQIYRMQQKPSKKAAVSRKRRGNNAVTKSKTSARNDFAYGSREP